jgi:RNA polymerase sigma-70 factor (ECF subfamily)
MEDVSKAAQLEKLMSELSWLKRLATALVRHESDADDLVQETWLAAAEHAPKDGRPLKPWLSRVALNLVRMRSRASKRRGIREAAVESYAESSPAPDELVSRVEAQRIVVDEVLRLAEPYRNTILLHYFEELSSAEIARRSGIPEGTVRRRLKVALDELRGRLRAEERKTGKSVLAALAPVAARRGAGSIGRTALGVVFMKKAIALVVVIIGVLFLGSRWYRHHTEAIEPVVASGRGQGSGAALAHIVPGDAAAAHVVVAVTDAAGPVADAMVRCAPKDGDVVVVKTARDGNASVDLAAGEWSIAASGDGHEPSATTIAVVAGRDARVALALAVGGRTLTGTVTDASGGTISGARIDAARLDVNTIAGRAVAVAFTDSAGRYRLAVGVGEVLVAASHAEYAPQTRYVDLGPTGATANFALVPGGVIEGVVRDLQTKQAVAGAVVRARNDSSALELVEARERVVKSDGTGKFRLPGLRPGAYELFAREGARSTRVPVRVGLGVAEQVTDVVVLVGPAATIRGKVVNDVGAPVAGVTVHAFDETRERANATSDTAGEFVLAGLAPSRWALRGASEQYVANGHAIVALKTSDVDGVVVRVRRGLEVKGHVEPREVCNVELAREEEVDPYTCHDLACLDSMMTSENGEFRFAPFGPGKASLAARCPNGDEGTSGVTIVADASERVVPVEPGGTIDGRLVDASGKPIVGVMVTAESASDTTRIVNGMVMSGSKAITSSGGAFEIRGLHAANYRLAALDRGRPMRAKKGAKLALAAGQHATGVELVVERPAGTIQGTVTGPDGAPIADAWVALYETLEDQFQALGASDDGEAEHARSISVQNDATGGGELPPALTDARGHFELTNVPHGRYQVIAEAQAGRLRGRAADVPADAEIAIQLASVSSLRGSVHGAHGPAGLFAVELVGPTSDIRSFIDGTFEFSRLEPGNYTIAVTSSDGTGKATSHIAAGEATSVDILLVTNATVIGRLLDKAGKPLSGVPVAIIPDQPPGQLQILLHEEPPTSGPDGRFQVEGPPGTMTLVILGRRPTLKRGIPLAAGKTVDVGDITVDEHQ